MTELCIKIELTTGQLDVMQRRPTAIAPRANQFTSELNKRVDIMTSMGLGAY